MSFEKTSAREIKNRRFQLPDGAIFTITRGDDLDVPYLERTVWFGRDKHGAPDSGDGHCLLRYLESLVEIHCS
jgi:hypothetical protein